MSGSWRASRMEEMMGDSQKRSIRMNSQANEDLKDDAAQIAVLDRFLFGYGAMSQTASVYILLQHSGLPSPTPITAQKPTPKPPSPHNTTQSPSPPTSPPTSTHSPYPPAVPSSPSFPYSREYCRPWSQRPRWYYPGFGAGSRPARKCCLSRRAAVGFWRGGR